MAQSAGVLLRTQVVTILGLEQKSGTGKNGKPYTISKVKASDGNTYDTFEIPLYQAAVQAGGAPVVLEYETRESNGYTNYDLKGVSLANGVSSPVGLLGLPAPVEAPAAVVAPVQTAPGVDLTQPSTFQQDKDARITRLSAARTAFDYAAALGLAKEDAITLAQKIELYANGEFPAPAPVTSGDGSPGVLGAPQLPWDDAE